MHLGSSYTGFATAPRFGALPGGGAVGDVLTLDAGLAPSWSTPVAGTSWPAPFVSSDGILLDDPRGTVGDKIWDGTNFIMYEKVDNSPDTWVADARGTIAP